VDDHGPVLRGVHGVEGHEAVDVVANELEHVRPIWAASAWGEVPVRRTWVRLQFEASAGTGSRWMMANRASG